jgi:hypothetical protein
VGPCLGVLSVENVNSGDTEAPKVSERSEDSSFAPDVDRSADDLSGNPIRVEVSETRAHSASSGFSEPTVSIC